MSVVHWVTAFLLIDIVGVLLAGLVGTGIFAVLALWVVISDAVRGAARWLRNRFGR